MSSSIWQPEHAAQLKRLRQTAGLDPIQLSKKHLITPTQIRQLEEGGDAAFYSAAIKYSVGRKLVASLGEELVDIKPPAMETTELPPELAGDRRPPRTERPSAPPPDQGPTVRRWPWSYLIGLSIAASASMMVLWLTNAPPEQTPPAMAPLENPTVEVKPEMAVEAPAPPDEAPQADSTPVRPPAPEVEGCAWTADPSDLTPAQGTRPADYIYLVGLQNSTVCWRDARQKTEKIKLRPNESINLPGQPPFAVYSPDPEGFNLYYKGQLIRMKHNGVMHIILGSP